MNYSLREWCDAHKSILSILLRVFGYFIVACGSRKWWNDENLLTAFRKGNEPAKFTLFLLCQGQMKQTNFLFVKLLGQTLIIQSSPITFKAYRLFTACNHWCTMATAGQSSTEEMELKVRSSKYTFSGFNGFKGKFIGGFRSDWWSVTVTAVSVSDLIEVWIIINSL